MVHEGWHMVQEEEEEIVFFSTSRREIDAEFIITEYNIKKITLFFYILWKILMWN